MLFMVVYPSGKKSFAFSYKDPKTRKLKRVILGQYPKMSLVEARNERVKLQYNLEKHNSLKEKSQANETFGEICDKYFAQKNDILPKTLQVYKNRVRNYCAKILDYKIDAIEKADILDIFERLKLAKKAVAKKLFSDLNNIFIYAINRDFVEQNPLSSIIKRDIIYKAKTKHHATIVEQDKVARLIGDVLGADTLIYTKVATLMSLLTAQRSFSVRSAEWCEIDLDKGIWQIPAEKMKMKRPHIVHLSRPLVNILREYQAVSDEKYLFGSIVSKSKIISDGTIRVMFRRMGYTNDDFTPHGFRFCTIATNTAASTD